MFVPTERVAVTVDGKNIIYVRPKMGAKQYEAARGKALHINLAEDGTKPDVDVDMGAYNYELLVGNILAWEGPDFEGVACIPFNIANLDPQTPLYEKVLEEINARNTKKEGGPSPNLASSSGDGPGSSQAGTKGKSESGTSM